MLLECSRGHTLVVSTLPSTAEIGIEIKDIQKIMVSEFLFLSLMHKLVYLNVYSAVFWDMKFEKLLVMGWCLEVSHLVMMWLSLTGPSIRILNDLLSPGTLWNYIVLCLSVKSSLKQEWKLLPVREWYTEMEEVKKMLWSFGKENSRGTSELCHEQAHSISLWSQGKGTLETIEKVFKSGKKPSDGEKTLRGDGKKNEIVLETLYSPQGHYLATGTVIPSQIPLPNIPNFYTISYTIKPWRFSQ